MAALPSAPAASRERFVHRLFDLISPRYDLFNRLASLGLDKPWRKRAIASLNLSSPMRVLDLASGTGDLSALASERIVPLGQVAACDLSFPMLRLATRKFETTPPAYWHARPIQGRAEALPFAAASFDAATMAFALRNVSDLATTFSELHRVLKPDGRIALLEFGRPKNLFMRFGHLLWLTFAVPAIGLLTTVKLWPFLYLRRSILQFMPPQEVLQHLKEAGFDQTQATPLTLGAVILYQAKRR